VGGGGVWALAADTETMTINAAPKAKPLITVNPFVVLSHGRACPVLASSRSYTSSSGTLWLTGLHLSTHLHKEISEIGEMVFECSLNSSVLLWMRHLDFVVR
jgi:hypothetical protein